MVCCGCELLLVIVSFDDVGRVVFLALRSVVLSLCLGFDSDMLILGWLLKYLSDCNVIWSILVGWFLDFVAL